MSSPHRSGKHGSPPRKSHRTRRYLLAACAVLAVLAASYVFFRIVRGMDRGRPDGQPAAASAVEARNLSPAELWVQRSRLVDELYHGVYTPGWEGAYGAIGDAYLFAATGDSSLLRFHTVSHPLTRLSNGTWLDDRAWACLAELTWWAVTGRKEMQLVSDAASRYQEARAAGMLSNRYGYWTWYNYPPAGTRDPGIFTNSNMNQMVSVACRLYAATGDRKYLNDALLVWNGDRKTPGIEKQLYKGGGVWEGRKGQAAFGKELPWDGAAYCSIGAAMYAATGDPKYRDIVVATARHILDPATGWVDPSDFYQIQMDGNGAFVNFLMDAYFLAPEKLKEVPEKVEKMLVHVWTNHHHTASVVLHRESDNGIRNGWNPWGGEDGYGVDEVGTVHAQGEAARAFGIFAYYKAARGTLRSF